MALPIQYQPFKYQETELPTQLVPLLGASAQRSQQRYDTTNQSLAAMNRELDETDTYDPETKQMVMGKIKSKIDEIDQRYNGDMSAGMNDYIQLIGKAKNDPYWGLAKKQIENVKRLNELKDRFGADLLVANDPTQQKLFNSETGKYISASELEPITLRRSELEKDPLLRAKELSQVRRELGISKNPKLPGYLTKTTLTGLTPQEVERRFGVGKENEGYKMAVQQLNSTPTLNNYLEKQGITSTEDKLKWVQEFNYDVLKNNLGYKEDTQELVDQDYVEGLRTKRSGIPPTGPLIPFSKVNKIDTSGEVEGIDKKFEDYKKSLKEGTFKTDKLPKIGEKVTDVERPAWLPKSNFELLKERAEKGDMAALEAYERTRELMDKTSNTLNKGFEKEKKDYSILYKMSKNDKEFLDNVHQLEKENSKLKYGLYYHPDPKSQDYFTKGIAKSIYKDPNTIVSKLGKDGKPVTSLSSYKGTDIGDVVDSSIDLYNGEVMVTNNKGERFLLSKDNLGEDVEANLSTAQEVLKKTIKWNDEAFVPTVGKIPQRIEGGEMGYPIYIKTPKNTIVKYMSADPEGKDLWTDKGKPVLYGEYTPGQISQALMYDIYAGVNVYLNEIPK